jgi:acyl-coenzyme A synthetase/AMP-(fatty) acid ligase
MILSIDDRARQDLPALIDGSGDAIWTYGRLVEEVSKRRDWLRGPNKGLLFLFCRNDLPLVAWFLAAVEAGHAVALLNDQMDAQLAEHLISAYHPDWLVGSVEFDRSSYTCAESGGYWLRKNPDESPLHPDLALLLSTSGSTGSPKFVRLSRENIESNAMSIREGLSIVPTDVPIAHLPFHYSYGLSVVTSHLLTGAAVVLSRESLLRPAFWQTIRSSNVNSFSGVPYTYQMLRRLGLENVNAPTLNVMTQAGGKLDNDSISHFHAGLARRQGRFYVMYGQTEATARIAILPSADLPEKLGSAGKAIPGGTIEIRDDLGNPTSAGSEGELVYSGPNVMLGYATERADLGRGDELNGRLLTGDRARLDDQGYIYVLGRAKRDAKVFGLRINLDELEALVKRSGPAAAVGGSDRIVIFCEFGDEATYREICSSLAARLKIHQSAFEFRCIDCLPTNDSGKINYEALTARI